MTTITTKLSVGDTCYVVIHPTADIFQCVVSYVRIMPARLAGTYDITYKVTRTDNVKSMDYVKEAETFTFSEAKVELLAWLTAQTLKITNMTEPV